MVRILVIFLPRNSLECHGLCGSMVFSSRRIAIGFVYAMYNGDSGFLQGHSFACHGLQASRVVFFKDSFECQSLSINGECHGLQATSMVSSSRQAWQSGFFTERPVMVV
jgi:hypothetical protein